MKFEMGEQFIIRKFPKARTIVRHNIVIPLEVAESLEIAIVALVNCLQAK